MYTLFRMPFVVPYGVFNQNMNISFTKLGNEQCEVCVAHGLHQCDPQNYELECLDEDCPSDKECHQTECHQTGLTFGEICRNG